MNKSSLSEITHHVKSNFNYIFDEKLGIVNKIYESESLILKIPFYSYYAEGVCNSYRYYGSGTAMNRDTALSKAIGECLERYCLSTYNHKCKDFIQTTCDSLENRYSCICPKSVELYSLNELEQIGFNQYNPSFETFFCIGYNATKNIYQYVPIPMVYLKSSFFNQYSQKMNIIQQTISTGASFGTDFYQTALMGVYESIERDAMMAFWLLSQSAPKIELTSLKTNQKNLVKEITKNNIEVSLFDISLNEAVFVILSCLHSENSKLPAIVFSAAAHHNIDCAIQKSLEEVTSTLDLAESLMKKNRNKIKDFLDFEKWRTQVIDRDDHVVFWSYHELFNKFSSKINFILNSNRKISRKQLERKNKNFSDYRSSFLHVIKQLKILGFDVILIDISNSDISNLGFMCLKAVIPGFLPLHLGHNFTYSQPRRLFEIAKSVYRLNPKKIFLNKTPHPFP